MNIQLKFLPLLYIFILSTVAQAQYDFSSVFPDQTGQELENSVRNAYKPSNVLNYSLARDSMFKNVYGVNDSVACIYTGYRLYMTPGQDPTDAVYLNGAANGINTEHSWPQSYGAGSGQARSNMHHLYPSRSDVNGARANLPFQDVQDNQTDTWYFMGNQQGGIPGQNIDAYSELGPNAFEPRESQKGNIARSIMYFKTIYPNESQQAPAGWWESMIPHLCKWHGEDPVDQLEWERTFLIANYQSGKTNPFVLDCTLAARLFCSTFDGTCDPSVSTPIKETTELAEISIFPNPASSEINISCTVEAEKEVKIFNAIGQLQMSQSFDAAVKNLQINLDLAPGIFILQIQLDRQIQSFPIIIR